MTDRLRSSATISDAEWVQAIADIREPLPDGRGYSWVLVGELAERLDIHPNRVRSKARRAHKRGLSDGCTCGCRGDFVLLHAGELLLARMTTASPADGVSEVTGLSPREQVAVMEVLGEKLDAVASGSVQYRPEPDARRVVIGWLRPDGTVGMLGIPTIQFDAIRSAVETERTLAELAAPPAYADADHTTHQFCDPTLGCIERTDQ